MPINQIVISHTEARVMMDAALRAASDHGVPGAIAVVDAAGHLILAERRDGTMHAAINIAIGKAATAVAFQRPTAAIEDVVLAGRSPMLTLDSVTPQPYVPLKGGHPITQGDKIIGGLAVAGTMDADMDEVIAIAALQSSPR
ncbi:MAG: hypothetical protein SynsKO_43160 [Synoicihabitans sp.]